MFIFLARFREIVGVMTVLLVGAFLQPLRFNVPLTKYCHSGIWFLIYVAYFYIIKLCMLSINQNKIDMKKLLWTVGAMMCAMAMFTACSDDDDNNGGNGEIKEKKLVRVERQGEGSSYKEITLFDYDVQGRLSKITYTDEDGDNLDVYTVIYSTDKITVSAEDGDVENIYDFNDDGSMEKWTNEYYMYGDRDQCLCQYSDGYLSRMDYTYFEDLLPEGEEMYDIYHVSDGNLTVVEYVRIHGQEKNVGTDTIEVSEVKNNMNIDFIYNECFASDYGHEFLFGVTGNRYQNLPARIFDDEDETVFEYTVDEEGYVRKAKTDYEIYTFIYEE